MATRKKSYPIIEVDARERTSSLDESFDDPNPQKLMDPEREHIFADLKEHDDRLKDHEMRLRDIESNQSMPVTINGPKGFSVTGSWRVVLTITGMASIVAIVYVVFHYLVTK